VVCAARTRAYLLWRVLAGAALKVASKIVDLFSGERACALGFLGSLSLAALRCARRLLVFQSLDLLKMGTLKAYLPRGHCGGLLARDCGHFDWYMEMDGVRHH